MPSYGTINFCESKYIEKRKVIWKIERNFHLELDFGWLCDRLGKCVEISIYHRTIRWSCICIDLSVLPDHSRAADPCYGICSRKSQSEEYCKILSGVRAERNKMALVQLCWYGWKLSVDDVLHDSSRMDDQLFL